MDSVVTTGIMSPNDYLLVAIVIGVVQYLKNSWEWIALADGAMRKNRIKITAGFISAILAFAMSVLIATHPIASLAFWCEWLLRCIVSWIASMGGFDWLKLVSSGLAAKD